MDLTDRDGSFTIRVPVDWLLEEVEDDAIPEHQTAFRLQLPDGEGFFSVIDNGNVVNPRGGPAWELQFRDEEPGAEAQLWSEPVPHLLVSRRIPTFGDWRRISAFVHCRGRTYEFDLTGRAATVERASADLLAVAATLKTTAPEWPPITKDYRVVRVGDYRFAVHRSVTEPTERFEKSIRDAQKVCDRLYGRMPLPAPGEPIPVVYLHSERAQQEAILPRLKDTTTSNTVCYSGLCIFVVSKEEDAAGDLVYLIGEFNTVWRWGATIPFWLRIGERIVVANIRETGADLPFVTAQRFAWREGLVLRPLPELTFEAAQKDWTSYCREAFFYGAFFHAGPKNCQAAYRAFLDDVRKSCDPVGAVKRHLEPLGYDRLREDAERFMRESIAVAEGK